MSCVRERREIVEMICACLGNRAEPRLRNAIQLHSLLSLPPTPPASNDVFHVAGKERRNKERRLHLSKYAGARSRPQKVTRVHTACSSGAPHEPSRRVLHSTLSSLRLSYRQYQDGACMDPCIRGQSMARIGPFNEKCKHMLRRQPGLRCRAHRGTLEVGEYLTWPGDFALGMET